MRLYKLHIGREVSIYAFCGILAAKVKLMSVVARPLISLPLAPFVICTNYSDFHGRNVIPSDESGVWPDGKALD